MVVGFLFFEKHRKTDIFVEAMSSLREISFSKSYVHFLMKKKGKGTQLT